jgi:hypothetical protein
VRDNACILVELLGEEVDAEVAVLPGLGGRGDADDLAWSALEVEDVSGADVVAWNGDGFSCVARSSRDDGAFGP